MRERMKAGLHRLFMTGQRLGLDILPRHFYSAIPDLRALKKSASWRKPFSMIGIAGAEIESQAAFVEECCAPIQERLRRGDIYSHACLQNGEPGYGPVEAEFLFGFVFSKRPNRVVQVGCGVSTAVILLAAQEAKYEPAVSCIDPYPTEYLRRIDTEGRIRLIRQEAEEVDLEVLTDLEAGDLLFIDSTHAVRPGSEVNRIILEVLPRLRPGVFIHFHDVYLPYGYQPDLMTSLFFSAESALLHAFLIHNCRCRIVASLSMLHHACAVRIRQSIPNYEPARMQDGLYATAGGHFPSSIYLRIS